MKIFAHNKGDLVRWRLVSLVNQNERHDVFAGTPALKVFRMSQNHEVANMAGVQISGCGRRCWKFVPSQRFSKFVNVSSAQ